MALSIASTHSFATCAILTFVPLLQSLQMISSVLLSFPFNLLLLSHTSPLSPAISYLPPSSPKNSQNSFSRNNIFTFSFHHSFTSQQANLIPSLQKPLKLFSNPPTLFFFCFYTSLISSLAAPLSKNLEGFHSPPIF